MKCIKLAFIFLIISILLNKSLIAYQEKNFYSLISKNEQMLIKEQEIKSIINKIPVLDLKNIKKLFEYLFKFSELSFSLYGDKPVSFCSLIVQPSTFSKFNHIDGYAERILKGDKIYQEEWNAWNKYKHLFKITNYILISESIGIVLINKKNSKV